MTNHIYPHSIELKHMWKEHRTNVIDNICQCNIIICVLQWLVATLVIYYVPIVGSMISSPSMRYTYLPYLQALVILNMSDCIPGSFMYTNCPSPAVGVTRQEETRENVGDCISCIINRITDYLMKGNIA